MGRLAGARRFTGTNSAAATLHSAGRAHPYS